MRIIICRAKIKSERLAHASLPLTTVLSHLKKEREEKREGRKEKEKKT